MADPVVSVPIPNQLVKKGQTISISLATNITDADVGGGGSDILVYSLGGVPSGSGLSVNPTSGILSGTITSADIAGTPFTAVVTARRQSNGTILNTTSIPFPAVLAAEAWHFGLGGNNALDGRSFATRKANYSAVVSAGLTTGDIVYMCSSAAGLANRWTMTEQINVVAGVTYKVFSGHYVLLDVSTSGTTGAFSANGVDGWTLEPGDGFLEMGDPTDWNPVWPSDGHGFSSARQLNILNCDNWRIIGTGTGNHDDTDSNLKIHGGKAWVANFVDQNCDTYMIKGVDFSRHGSNNQGPDTFDDGDMCLFAGIRSYIYKNTFRYGGHINCRFMGRSQYIEENDFDGDWTGVTPNADAGRGAPIERSGNRCCGVYSAVDDDEGTRVSPYGPVAFHNNIFRKAGSAGDEHDNCVSEINASHVIVRFNYAWDCCNDLWRSGTFIDNSPFGAGTGYFKIYNNTAYGNGSMFQFRHVEATDGDVFIQIDVMNNIMDEMKGVYFSGLPQIRRTATNEDTEGFPDEWKGGRWEGNIAKMHSSAPEGATIAIRLDKFSGATSNFTWANIEATYPSVFSDNGSTSPTYLGNPAGGTRTRAAFAPNGGTETGNAQAHAIASGAGASSTTLTVDSGQARMFFDGWGLTGFGPQADWIKIGSGTPVQIASVNSATSITLTSPRSWSDNDEVFLVQKNGTIFTVVSDIGAGQ